MPIMVSIVEDDETLRELMSEWIMQEADLKLGKTYPDAESALVGLPGQKPDVVLMDINLPRQSGIDCVSQLKPRLKATQFVMVTVHMDADLIFRALAAGATGYMLKRSTCDEVLAAIREVHAGGSPMSRAIARLAVEAFQRVPAGVSDLECLTERELEVLRLLSSGLMYKEIADQLNIKFNTVHVLSRHIYEKLQVNSRKEATTRFRMAIQPGPSPKDRG